MHVWDKTKCPGSKQDVRVSTSRDSTAEFGLGTTLEFGLGTEVEFALTQCKAKGRMGPSLHQFGWKMFNGQLLLLSLNRLRSAD